MLGMAFGRSSDGRKVLIRNGDLLQSDRSVVVVTEDTGNYLKAEIEETHGNTPAVEQVLDKDGLVPAKDLSLLRPGVFSIRGKYVFPVWQASRIVAYLSDKPDLWNLSRFAVSTTRGVRAGAFLFGFTFQKAIRKLTIKGYQAARLYCIVPEKFLGRGQVVEMLAAVHTDKEDNWVLEIWQGVSDVPEVLFAHAILQRSTGLCTHFDTAVIGYSIEDQARLFKECRKIKAAAYKKVFRIDGALPMNLIHELANRFFPLDELIDEYFEVEPL